MALNPTVQYPKTHYSNIPTFQLKQSLNLFLLWNF
jgi:hypothetical protein